MRRPRLFEFLDPDGGYAIVRPLDGTRGRVVVSNVREQGEILYKDPRWTWKEAGAVREGSTRLGPSDFPRGSAKEQDLDLEDFQGHEEDRTLFALLARSKRPRSRSRVRRPCARALYPDGPGEPPEDLLMHLVVHYLRMTEAGHDDGRWHHLCGCPEERLHGKNLDVLGDVIAVALRERGLPSLETIIVTLRDVRAEEELSFA